MSHHLYRQYAPTVVNNGTSQDEMPLWHGGDGRSYHANPLFPMYNAPVRTPSGDGQGRRVSGTPRASGDGLGARSASGDGLGARSASGDAQSGRAPDVVLNVNPLPAPARKGTQRTDTWKLVALVFVFFIWIGTASTLLFLYMDQYLFP